jgi:RHS repeat-associated protein
LRRWARGVETRYGYDALGQLSVANHSDATPDVFLTRDRLGRPRRVEERGPTLTNVTLLTNHLAGHLLSEARGGVLVTNGYDARFRRTQMRMIAPLWNETTTYGYDPASRLVGVTNGGYATEYQYLPGSSLVWDMVGWDLATPGGPLARLASQRVFDGLDRVTELNHLGGGGGGGGALAAGYATGYNPAGQRPSVTHADGTRWEYQYDPLGQLSRAERFWANGSFFLGQQFSYTHDTAGNRISARPGSVDGSPVEAYYLVNAMNQLTHREVFGFATVSGRAAANATVTVNHQLALRHGPAQEWFGADLVAGNIDSAVWLGLTNVAVINPPTPGVPDIVVSNVTLAYIPKTPQIFTYDADGNQTSDGRWTNRWDAENRLIETESLSTVPPAYRQKLVNTYDWQSRRMTKVVSNWNVGAGAYQLATSERFVYDGWKVISVLTSNLIPVTSYVWGLDLAGQQNGRSLDDAGAVGGLVMANPFGGRPVFCASDLQGNVTTLIDALNGTVTGRFEYGPFGETLRATGPAAALVRLRFSTKYEDTETGWVYYGYRFYDPVTGRWVSRDPIEEKGGINLYGFVVNDPINAFDPLGLDVSTPFRQMQACKKLQDALDTSANDQVKDALGEYIRGGAKKISYGQKDPWTVALQKHSHLDGVRAKIREQYTKRCAGSYGRTRDEDNFNLNSLSSVENAQTLLRDLAAPFLGINMANTTGSIRFRWQQKGANNCCCRQVLIDFIATDTLRLGSNTRIPMTTIEILTDNALGQNGPFHNVDLEWKWSEIISY